VLPGSETYWYSASDPSIIDLLPVKAGDSYRVWVICKVDTAVNVEFKFKGVEVEKAVVIALDQESYVQYCDPAKQRTVIERRTLKTFEVPAGGGNTVTITFKGYTVALLELKLRKTAEQQPPTPEEKPAPQEQGNTTILLVLLLSSLAVICIVYGIKCCQVKHLPMLVF